MCHVASFVDRMRERRYHKNRAVIFTKQIKMRGLSAFALKSIAVTAMLIDHIAAAFVPTASILGQVMHLFGRITGPVMCFFIAEGYFHTRNRGRYALRLLVFALISCVPFALFNESVLPQNVLFTLLLGLLALHVWETMQNRPAAAACILGLCLLAIPFDWTFIGVLLVLLFGSCRDDRARLTRGYAVISALFFLYVLNSVSRNYWHLMLYQAGIFLPLPLLRMYNGRRGGERLGQAGKYIFYWFYPLHLAAIALIKHGLFF